MSLDNGINTSLLLKENGSSKGYYILQAKSFLFFFKNGKFLAFYMFFPFHSDVHLLGKGVSSKKSN